MAISWTSLFEAMKILPVGNAVLLNYVAPILVALLSPIFLGESIERSTIISLGMSTVGIFLIALSEGFSIEALSLTGIGYGLLAGLTYAFFIILSKRTLAHMESDVMGLYAYFFASLFLAPSLLRSNLLLDLVSWILLLVLGAFNTGIVIMLYFDGLRVVSAQKAAVLGYLESASSILFGYLFLSERPTINMITGGALIVLAGYVATRPSCMTDGMALSIQREMRLS